MPDRVSGGDDPYLGRVLDRQFRVDAAIGAGAMARVYRAHQLGVGRDVAVKILRAELLTRTEVVSRFRGEAELVGRLVHPHVVVVHATGEMRDESTGAPGEPYVVLEWLEGPSLTDLLASVGGRLPLPRALHIVLALCDAVGEAHARGIVHRDLKPDNVILVRRGEDIDFVKLLDFGLSRVLDEQLDPRTRAGSILGTPRYLSPEGAEGLPVTPASDSYSLATLLYQCLAGRTPFEAESPVAVLALQATAAPPDVRSWEPSLPEPLARVIMQNLEKRAGARAPDARALGRQLVGAARAIGIDAQEIGLSSTLLGTRRGSAVSPTLAIPGPAERHVSGDPAASAHPPETPRKAPLFRRASRAMLFIACFLMGVFAAVTIISRQNERAVAPVGTAP